MANRMSLELFRSTRKEVADLGTIITDYDDLEGCPGLVYVGDLHIERRCDSWAGSPADKFEYMLVIGNQSWLSDNLAELEAHLYDFAVSEGLTE